MHSGYGSSVMKLVDCNIILQKPTDTRQMNISLYIIVSQVFEDEKVSLLVLVLTILLCVVVTAV